MGPLFLALVWLVAAAHFAYLIYLPLGGFLALRWRRTIWLHLVAVLWAIGSVTIGFDCPLTDVEQWARSRAGIAPLPASGFIDHYLTGVLYPVGYAGQVRVVVFAAVVLSWIAYAMTRRRRPEPDPR